VGEGVSSVLQGHRVPSYLEHINTLASDMAKYFVFLIEVSAEHLRGLVDRVFNFDRDATPCLGLLHHVHALVIDFQGRTENEVG